jgi:hypothetical protein
MLVGMGSVGELECCTPVAESTIDARESDADYKRRQTVTVTCSLISISPLFSLAPQRTATGRARVWSHVIDWGLLLVVAFGGTYPVVDVIRTNARSSWSFTSLALVLVLSFTLLCK